MAAINANLTLYKRSGLPNLLFMFCKMAQSTQESFEAEFRKKLFEKYAECQKYLIPKEVN